MLSLFYNGSYFVFFSECFSVSQMVFVTNLGKANTNSQPELFSFPHLICRLWARGNRNQYFVSVLTDNMFLVQQKREEREVKAFFHNNVETDTPMLKQLTNLRVDTVIQSGYLLFSEPYVFAGGKLLALCAVSSN